MTPPDWKRAANRVSMLSPRQREVLGLLADGHSNQQAADRIGVPLVALKELVTDLLWTLGLPSREEAAAFWVWHRSRRTPSARIGALVPRRLRAPWLGWAALTVLIVAISVPLLLLRGGGESRATPASPTLAPVTSVVPSTVVAGASLAPSGGLPAPSARPFPPKGPDGRLAYLNADGDLVVQPLTTGRPAVVREGPNLRSPAWSAGGDYLAVVENGHLLVLSDGAADPVVVAPGPDQSWQWSPIGDVLAVFTSGGMILYDPATGDQRTIRGQGAPLSEQPGPVIWSPDGTRILYTYYGRHTAAPTETIHEMRVFDTRTGQDHLLLERVSPPASQTVPVGWSPDGEWVYYRDAGVFAGSAWVDGVPLFAMPSAGGDASRLEITLGHSGMFAAASGGSRAAYLAGGGRFASLGTRRVSLIDGPEGARLPQAAPGTHAHIAWAPDGSRLAYVAMPDPPPNSASGQQALEMLMNRKIWVQEVGQPALQLTNDPAYRDEHPSWSPDGTWLLFTRIDAQGAASIWRVPTGAGTPERLADRLGLGEHGVSGIYGWIPWHQLMDWWQP